MRGSFTSFRLIDKKDEFEDEEEEEFCNENPQFDEGEEEWDYDDKCDNDD